MERTDPDLTETKCWNDWNWLPHWSEPRQDLGPGTLNGFLSVTALAELFHGVQGQPLGHRGEFLAGADRWARSPHSLLLIPYY